MSGENGDNGLFAIFGNGSDGRDSDDHATTTANIGHGFDDADPFFMGGAEVAYPGNIWGNIMDFGSSGSGSSHDGSKKGSEGEDSKGEGEKDPEMSQEESDPPPIADSDNDEAEDEVEEDDEDFRSDEAIEAQLGHDARLSRDMPQNTVEDGDGDDDDDLPVVTSDIPPPALSDVVMNDDEAEDETSDNIAASVTKMNTAPGQTDSSGDDKGAYVLEEEPDNDDDQDGRVLDEDDDEEVEKAAESLHSQTDDDGDLKDGDGIDAGDDAENGDDDQGEAIDADLVMPGDGSWLKVVIEPLPLERHDEYEIAPPTDYVHRIIARVRGRSRYSVEYDDGRIFEVSSCCAFGRFHSAFTAAAFVPIIRLPSPRRSYLFISSMTTPSACPLHYCTFPFSPVSMSLLLSPLFLGSSIWPGIPSFHASSLGVRGQRRSCPMSG